MLVVEYTSLRICECPKHAIVALHKVVHLRNLKNALVVNAQAFLS